MFKRILSILLIALFLWQIVPVTALAADSQEEYSISNGYLTYTINTRTGGFSILTKEGHPDKQYDNNIPLLYRETRSGMPETSYVTVRIDGKDYIFGRDYGLFGLDSKLSTPVVSEGGRLITVAWTIRGYTVTQRVALSNDADTDLQGNVGIEYSVANNSGSAGTVGIRVLLDAALGNDVDGPYVVVDMNSYADCNEHEYSAANGDMPQQLRAVDKLINATKMSYLFFNTWSKNSTAPDRVIVGHWANLANTRYDYTPDLYCDYTNYSNAFRVPDTAYAVFWSEEELANGATRTGELLYGVGSFSSGTEGLQAGLDVICDPVELNETRTAYKSNEIQVNVNLDNSLDQSVSLSSASVTITVDQTTDENGEKVDDGLHVVGSQSYTFALPKGTARNASFTVKVDDQASLTAKRVFISLDAVTEDGDKVAESVARYIFIPGLSGKYPKVTFDSVSPGIVYTEGEKAVTVTGSIEALKALNGSSDWDLWLEQEIKTGTGQKVCIAKKSLTFLSDQSGKLNGFTFLTSEKLAVGTYKIVFRLGTTMQAEYGVSEFAVEKKLEVSADKKYATRSYGVAAIVRYGTNHYKVLTFDTEQAYQKFMAGESTVEGIQNNFNEGENFNQTEVLVTVRGRIHEASRENQGVTEKYWQAECAEDPVTINGMLSYQSDNPLLIEPNRDLNTAANTGWQVTGDGTLKVINSITVWNYEWSIGVTDGDVYTLNDDESDNASNREVVVSLGGAAFLIQSIGGFLVDLKYGVLNAEADNGLITHGVSFGGSIEIPIKGKGDDENQNNNENNNENNNQNSNDNNSSNENNNSGSSDNNSSSNNNNNSGSSDNNSSSNNNNNSGSSDNNSSSNNNNSSGSSDNNSSNNNNNSNSNDNNNSNSSSGSGGGGGTGSSNANDNENKFDEKKKVDKDTNFSDGKLAVTINNISFGEIANEDRTEIVDTGYQGIDAEAELALPKDVLGDLIKNVAGIYAHVEINTFENRYALTAGVKIKVIEVEATLAFKETEIAGKQAVVPDRIAFYIRDGLRIPIAPPLFMTGLGGGVSDLADTIGGEFDELPPITLDLFTRLALLERLTGDFTLKANCFGLELEGDMKIKGVEEAVELKVGISARWIDPWHLSLQGEIGVLDGILKGIIKVLISDSLFGGYAYVGVCIPDDVPLIGGKEIAGLEFAVNNHFIGGNAKLIGITFGMIYYWGGSFDVGEGIDLSLMESAYPDALSIEQLYAEDGSKIIAVFGSNIHRLPDAGGLKLMDGSAQYTLADPAAEDAIILETRYLGDVTPKLTDLTFTVNGTAVPLMEDDGKGNGNCIIQTREDGTYIYITDTDLASLPDNSVFTLSCSTGELGSMSASGADSAPELTGVTVSRSAANSRSVSVSWDVSKTMKVNNSVDIFVTTTPDAVKAAQVSDGAEDSFGFRLKHLEEAEIKNGSCTIELPESLASGDYYVLVMIGSDAGGMTTWQTAETFPFTNPDLPAPVQSATLSYAGNGELRLRVQDAANVDYTHYIVELESADGSPIRNNLAQYGVGGTMVFGSTMDLRTGTAYRARIITLRETEDGKFFYGDRAVYTNYVTVPVQKKPVLQSVTSNITVGGEALNAGNMSVYAQKGGYLTDDTLVAEYVFEDNVYMTVTVNGEDVVLNDLAADGSLIPSNSFHFTKSLADGDYAIDFTAVNPSTGDWITGKDLFEAQPEAVLCMTVDTQGPVLALDQTRMTSLEDSEELFGGNTVFSEADGSYVICGITENRATLTVNGSSGVAAADKGRFEISGRMPASALYEEVLLEASDPAGNTTQALVTVVNASLQFKGIELDINGSTYSSGAELKLDPNDVRNVRIYAIAENGAGGTMRIELAPSEVKWEIVGERNIIRLEEAEDESLQLMASMPGETVLGFTFGGAELNSGAKLNFGTEDYIRIVIGESAGPAPGPAPGPGPEPEPEPEPQPGGPTHEIRDLVSILKFTNGHGEISLSRSSVLPGSSVEVSVTPDEGYILQTLRVNGVEVEAKDRFTVQVLGNTTIEAIFAPKDSPAAAWVNPFKDIRESDWFYQDVAYAYQNKWMNGVSADSFDPKASLTRATFVTVLYRFALEPEAGENPFLDVAAGSWYELPVAWASGVGVVNGVGDGRFAPNNAITREQMATMIYRYLKFIGHDVSAGEDVDLSVFTDAGKISAYALEGMRWAVGSGLFRGRSETELAPDGIATRAEIATVFRRLEALLK